MRTQAIFAQKHIPLQIHDTVINGRHLHYAVSGPDSLPTLVFIHGSPGSWSNYMKYMWDTSLRKRFRFVGIDRPGFGYSDFGKAMHLQDQCAISLPVLRSLKTNKPMYLCGHSMGGPVVIQLAASAPELFDKIVIVAGAIDLAQEPKDNWRKVMAVKPLFWCLPGAYAPSNTELLYLKKDLIPLQQEFSKITAEVYFLHGTADNWVPIENVAYGEKMLNHARSIHSDTIVGADHQIPWKNREVMKELLLHL
jgi:pimeloyl-ACP methyl ester carboxylesterase